MSFDPGDMDQTALMDQMLAELRRIAEAVEWLAKHTAASTVQSNSGGAVEPASDADLDGQYGDPTVKKNPTRWKGQSFEGKKMSECTPEFLDVLSELYEWKAANPRGYGNTSPEKAAQYARKDASRARGWAKRLRSGWKPKTTQPADDGSVPF